MLTRIKELVEKDLPGAMVKVDSDDDVHFSLMVISEAFKGLNKVQQQQRIYAILGGAINSGEIHALSMKTYTPEAWAALNEKG